MSFAQPSTGHAATQLPAGFQNELLGAFSFPTGMAFTPDGRLLLAIQTGELRVYQNGSVRSAPVLDLGSQVCTEIERGLLGVAVDPGFADNHYVYVYYTYDKGNDSCGVNQAEPEAQPVNRLARFVLGDDSFIDPDSETVLIDNVPSVSGNHNAGDISFGKDGYLYLTTGDSGCDYTGASACGMWNNSATYRNALVGKVLRITSDGGIPIDNPHQGPGTSRCNQAGRTTPGDWCQEIYATGLRNPFRFAFDGDAPETRFFINDVGNDHWEEIDLGAPGADYGWNLREGHCAVASYTDCGPPPPGTTNPAYDYAHTSGCTSVTAGAFVPDGLWPSQYDPSYLYGDFVCGKLFQLVPNGSGGFSSTEFASEVGGVVAMAFGPPNSASKDLYYVTWASPPGLFRIRYTGTENRSPVAVATASPTNGSLPLTTNFSGDQSSDPDQQALNFDWDFGDGSPHSSAANPSHVYQTAGTYTATLTVSDGQGGQDTAEIRIDAGNHAPTPAIASPSPDQKFSVGETITLSGSATDPEDANLPGTQLSWQVVKHHATHTHPFLPPTTGGSAVITAPVPEDFGATGNSYLEVRLTATDSRGLSTTVSRELRPRLVSLNFATNPAGLRIDLNGTVAPPSITSWEGWTLQLSTPKTQFTSSGQGQNFVSWSDGGAPAHAITTPATPRTYTATFTPNYVRPRGAQKTRVSLVPAYRRCTAPTRAHGAPLSYPSCAPAAQTSGYATVGTPDANGSLARSIGNVQFRVLGASTPEDDADVEITASISDVFRAGAVPADYIGDLRVRTRLRMTDRLNGAAVADPGTVDDFFLNVPMPCTPTAELSGSACAVQTTADALFPGFVVESKRTLWELAAVQVFDGGADGSISTSGDTLFATQGVFIP